MRSLKKFELIREELEKNPPPRRNVPKGHTLGRDKKLRPLPGTIDVDARDDEILQLHCEGNSTQAIANEVNCSVGRVHRVIARDRSEI